MTAARHLFSLAAASTALLAAPLLPAGRVAAQSTPVGADGSRGPSLPENVVRRLRDTLSSILDAGVRDSAFPGAIAVVGTRSGVLVSAAAGRLDWAVSPLPTDSTLWDLASLTKVVGLTSAMMQLVDAGKVSLDAPVARYLPRWRGADREKVTVRHLLTHTAGLPAWRPLYKEALSPADAIGLVYATPLDTTPGARMVYSDLGAILLGQVVEQVSGEPFDEYVARHVFTPLGMDETLFRPADSLRGRIAPTEIDPWRQRHLRGEVHDENAFALGGVSSHAGLFSSARDLTRFARAYLNGGTLDGQRIFSPEVIERFTRVQNAKLSHRALGWETANGTNSGGHLLSARAFGHTGFTGTSLWIDPGNDLFILLLSNRVNPTREHRGISGVRVSVADAALAVVGRAAREPVGSRH
jgi:CubicO group peptidase (beta-lactamase class C family)